MFSQNSPVPQWLADLRERKMIAANDAALKFWRMTLEQFLNSRFEEFFHPDEMPRWEKYIHADQWGDSGTWKCVRGDGTTFYCVTRWQMTEYKGTSCAFVFPLRAGDSPTTMVELSMGHTNSRHGSI